MRILHIITRGDLGGAQVVVLNLVKNMPAQHELLVAAGETGYLKNECEKLGIPFHFVPGLVRNINPFSDLSALIHVVQLLRRTRPDIVHCHTSKAGIIARMAAALVGIPAVFTAHTWSFDGGMSKIKSWLAACAERFAASISGPIITVSEANRQKALKHHVAPADKIHRIWLGIPPAEVVQRNPGQDPVTIIMTARFVNQKDQSNLIKALHDVTGNWVLKLIGDGPMLNACTELANSLGIANRIQFLGERNDVTAQLDAADIFVLSTYWEGLPVSILEAMRAGLPVIASDVGGISEMVTDGTNGFLTRVADPQHLGQKLQSLIDQQELRLKMGKASRQRWEQDFSMKECIDKHIDLYSSLIR